MMSKLPFLFILFISINIAQIYSQLFENNIPIYDFNQNNEISVQFKKELDVFFELNPNENEAFLIFDAMNCFDFKYRCPILDSYIGETTSFYKGILFFKNKTLFLGADSNVTCKFDLFFEKIKDTTFLKNKNYSLYTDDNTLIIDDNGPYFYWQNLLDKDSILVKIPVAEPIKEYDLSGYYKKRWYPFTKRMITSPKRIKLKEEFDKTQLIYFVYTIEHGVPVYFYSFYSMDESNTDNLIVLILNNFNKSIRLKDEKYMGKAYSDGKYFIIDYTYLSIIR